VNRQDPQIGRYVYVEYEGVEYRIYYEENGQGVPLLCLHTAGADAREWSRQLSDPDLTRDFRVIAFDLPRHGRSRPPVGWQVMEDEYKLTSEFYTGITMAFAEAVGADQPIIMGSSMGGNVCLPLADRYPDRIRALIALEGADHTPGWYADVMWDSRVHGGEVCASAVMGEIAPMSPAEERWETWWIYATGGPGLFKGDIYFFSLDHDYRERAAEMGDHPPIYLMTGEYDGGTTPEQSRRTAEKLQNGTFYEMPGIGHFPMCENAALFKQYLTPVLDHIVNGSNVAAEMDWSRLAPPEPVAG
jgi:pimeloyl-ACP methyl ester carboxylesterase